MVAGFVLRGVIGGRFVFLVRGVFGAGSCYRVGWRTAAWLLFFGCFFAGIGGVFLFLRGEWALGYYSMEFRHFLHISCNLWVSLFISDNRPSLHLLWQENLVKHQRIYWNIMKMIVVLKALSNILLIWLFNWQLRIILIKGQNFNWDVIKFSLDFYVLLDP